MRKTGGQIGGTLISICTLMVFMIDTVCYACVFFKLRRAAATAQASTGGSRGSTKYHRSARVMVVFVGAYFIQNWPAMIYYIWAYLQSPPMVLIVVLVIFVNMGGLFNAFAYTFVRKRYQSVAANESIQTVSQAVQS